MYNFYIDDILIKSPIEGWDDFEHKIDRSIENRMITISYPTDLTFTGDGYNILFDAIETDGYDKEFSFRAIDVDSYGVEINEVRGTIFLIDADFELVSRSVKVQVKENGYIAKMFGNCTCIQSSDRS